MRTFLVAFLASILHMISTFVSMSIFIFRVLLTGDIVEVSCVWVSMCISIVSGI